MAATLVRVYQITWRHTPEDRNVDSHRPLRDPQTPHFNNVFLLSILTSF